MSTFEDYACRKWVPSVVTDLWEMVDVISKRPADFARPTPGTPRGRSGQKEIPFPSVEISHNDPYVESLRKPLRIGGGYSTGETVLERDPDVDLGEFGARSLASSSAIFFKA